MRCCTTWGVAFSFMQVPDPIIFILLPILLGLVVFIVYRQRKHRKRMHKLEQTIRDDEEKMETYRFEINKYRLSQIHSDEYRQKVTDLNERLLTLSAHNLALQEQLKGEKVDEDPAPPVKNVLPLAEEEEAFRLLLSLKKGTKRELAPEEWNQLFYLVDFLYDDFLSRLRETHPALTAHDLHICCLLKISLSHEDIARIFSTTTDSLTRAKGRLKKRLNSFSHLNIDSFVNRF